jgi:hypothetical protein
MEYISRDLFRQRLFLLIFDIYCFRVIILFFHRVIFDFLKFKPACHKKIAGCMTRGSVFNKS